MNSTMIIGVNAEMKSPRLESLIVNGARSDASIIEWSASNDWRECECAVNQILELCKNGEYELWITDRGYYDRRIHDTLLNELLASAGVKVDEWDSVGFRLCSPLHYDLIRAILFLPLIAHWGAVGINTDEGSGFVIDNYSLVRVIPKGL